MDSLASTTAVRGVLGELIAACPSLARFPDKRLRKLLQAMRHQETYSTTETRRGRPAHFDGGLMDEAGRRLKAILERETGGRVSLQTFVGHYLPILDWPEDVAQALARGELSRLEAAQAARLTAVRLGVREREAAGIRREIIDNHSRAQGSQSAMREKVREALGELTLVTSEKMTAAVERVDDLLRVDPGDRRHLFYEQMKDFFFALREIRPEEIDDPALDLLLARADALMEVVYAIQRRRKAQPPRTLRF
ncbi:MAG: hypothetical protein ACKVX9_06665 [Blastocatellia bacterium]